MISLKRIVEQQGADGQFYDLGRDFSNFTRTIDGSFDQIKQKFEQVIGSKLNGKRIRARASRGYKQYVKDYEFDVARITLDDYYDNYVVVAHDNSTPKPKEYFLKPGFKIQILRPANGQSSQGLKEPEKKPQQSAPAVNPDKAQSQPMVPVGHPQQVKETNTGTDYYDAYSIDSIGQDIKIWLPRILLKPETALRDFIVGLGWLKNIGLGTSVAMFDLKLPLRGVKIPLTKEALAYLLQSANRTGKISTKYDIVSVTPDEHREDVIVRVRKTMKDETAL